MTAPEIPAAPAVRRRTTLLAAVALFVTTGGPSVQIARWVGASGTVEAGWQGWIYLYPFGAVAVAGAVGTARWLAGRRPGTWPWPVWFVGAYVGWALLSAIWTVSPSTTATRAITGVGIAGFGLWFGARLRTAEQIWAVVGATAAAGVSSLWMIAFEPQWGRMPWRSPGSTGGEWQGIFGNRNSLSPVAVLGLLGAAGLVLLRPTLRRTVAVSPLIVLFLALLAGSGGMTATLAVGVAAGTAVAVPAIRWLARRGARGSVVAGVLVAGFCAVVWVVFANLDRLAEQVGRDPTLSRRRWIWDDVRGFIQIHPVRGHGFWAFWERPDLTAATYARHGDPYGSAHNAILEVTLGLGFIGLVAYLAVLLAAVVGVAWLVWRYTTGRSALAGLWWAVVLAFVLTQTLMESFVLWHSYNWILTIAATVVAFGIGLSGTGPGPVDDRALDASDEEPDRHPAVVDASS